MGNDDFEFPRVDRSALAVVPFGEDNGDREYWWSRTPEERLAHVEMLRRINYGDAATARLQRVLEITEVEWS
jgi:hypothetical protein